MIEKKKVLITVKTYPNLSMGHEELVCTAGGLEDGSWIRLYPIPFRQMDYDQQYKKYHWIEVDVKKRTHDMRPESYTPNMQTIKIGENVDTKQNWQQRKKYVLNNVQEDMAKIIELAHRNELSLCVFKPHKIIRFYEEEIKSEEREQYHEKMGEILDKRRQLNLFGEPKSHELVDQPDYRFKYEFEDINGKKSNMMIEDWEIHQLYRNCLHSKKSKESALADVHQKYWNDFVETKDLYLFLGTTLEFHRRKALNPFTIVGTFTPKKENQQP